MRIEEITLREIHMRLRERFETSFGAFQDRRILLVEICSEGLSGWGEATVLESPSYNSEATDSAWLILRDFLIPLVLGKDITEASALERVMAPVRGHEMAKAALENALWDIEAQQKAVPLACLLGATRSEIACGVSIGIQDSIPALLSRIGTELRDGYQRVKIKIKPGNDLNLVQAIRRQYPEIRLMVDANSAYSLADSYRLLALDSFNLMMIEQPLAWDDIYEHAMLQAQLRTPICLDECIHNAGHAKAAIGLRACGVINIKLGRVGGHGGARRVHDVCVQSSIPVWCGGMLESGIGRAHNIAMSGLPGFVLPGDVSASRRYWHEDIIEPEVEVTSRGTICLPTAAGLGFTVRRSRIEQLTVRRETQSATPVQIVAL